PRPLRTATRRALLIRSQAHRRAIVPPSRVRPPPLSVMIVITGRRLNPTHPPVKARPARKGERLEPRRRGPSRLPISGGDTHLTQPPAAPDRRGRARRKHSARGADAAVVPGSRLGAGLDRVARPRFDATRCFHGVFFATRAIKSSILERNSFRIGDVFILR